jgi:hypothetical protein
MSWLLFRGDTIKRLQLALSDNNLNALMSGAGQVLIIQMHPKHMASLTDNPAQCSDNTKPTLNQAHIFDSDFKHVF